MLYTKFENKTIIKGTLEAVDPLHIGSSEKSSLNPIEVDNSVLKDSLGNPVIPGSSIKGVVRSEFEAVMKSVSGNNSDIRVCDIHDKSEKKCVDDKSDSDIKEKHKNGELSNEQAAQKYYDACCDVCKLFGGRFFAGKLHFKDCYYSGEGVCKYEKRDGVGIDRRTGAAKKGVKYDYEIIPKGTTFDFELIAENLDEDQEKYLDFIIRILEGDGICEGDYISVGGMTTRGLGRIKLKDISKKSISKDDLKERLYAFMENPNASEEV